MSDNPQKIQNFLLNLIKSSVSTPRKKFITAAVLTAVLYAITQNKSQSKKEDLMSPTKPKKGVKGGKGNVDKEFFKRIRVLLKIVLPSYNCKEAFFLLVLTGLLVLRTFMSIWLAEVNGTIVRAIVNRSVKDFLGRLLKLMLFAIPSSAVNSGIEYLQKLLALSFRERLTYYYHDRYLKQMAYYKICNLDSRIQNPDQRITQDLDKWAQSLANMYLNFSKPVLDLILFSRKLSELVGWEGPALTIGWYFVSGILIRIISPSFGRYTAKEQKLEGEYRAKHTELLSHSEEIAFYNGHFWEKNQINTKFRELRDHINVFLYKRFLMGIYDSMLVKYGAVMVGQGVLGLPVFGPGKEKYLQTIGQDTSAITKDYIRNSSLLINLAKAIGRIVVSYKEVQNLAGYTTLIYEIKEVLDDLERQKYKRVMVKSNSLDDQDNEQSRFKHQETQLMDNSLANLGTIKENSNIIFDKVPILSPNGDTLIKEMSFRIEPGMHLMISGPNGCGKSSLFRILGELWPLFGGVLEKPSIESIFYIPQRPYLPNGTLRDQVIYPHSKEDMRTKNKMEDQDLQKLLEEVRLAYLVKREKGWDTVNDWNDVLSGGEKQRIAMARLIYHRPKYAILDECTSAVSVDVEGHLYSYMKSNGITLITVSHRETLWKYHDFLLKFLPDRNYEFKRMPDDKRI